MMFDHSGDYSEMLMDDVFDILTKKEEISWPLTFSQDEKVKLVEELLTHFLEHEDYLKVQTLEDLLDKMKGE